jgi:dCTP deaminase
MILKADIITKKLETGEPASDPLVITPKPDLNEYRDSGAASIDLRLGCWFLRLRHPRVSMLDVGETVSEALTAEALSKLHYVQFGDKFVLHPRAFVLGATLEWIRMPKDLAGYVTSRSSWGRRGLIIATATGVHPGFTGCLTLELFNSGEIPVALYPGMAISQFFIHMVKTENDSIDKSKLGGRRRPFLGAIELDDFTKALASE